jgi:hypothetical protein
MGALSWEEQVTGGMVRGEIPRQHFLSILFVLMKHRQYLDR